MNGTDSPKDYNFKPDRSRKIIHVDMDAFYATVEQRDRPELRDKAMAVLDPKGWGIISAASYKARELGVKGGMSRREALIAFPQLIIVPARLEVYQKASSDVHNIFSDYTDIIEPIFLDEAYLDVTNSTLKSATLIAREIRKRIEDELNLKASAGVSYNKFLAKLASDYIKPDGILVIRPDQGASFVENLDINLFHGIGKATAAKMKDLGIATGSDLRNHPLESLLATFGKKGYYYHEIGNGDDSRPVMKERIRKSFGVEESNKKPMATMLEIMSGLDEIVAKVWLKCTEYQMCGRHLTVKIRYTDFSYINKTHRLQTSFTTKEELRSACQNILKAMEPISQPVRLIGVAVAQLEELQESGVTDGNQKQLSFF